MYIDGSNECYKDIRKEWDEVTVFFVSIGARLVILFACFLIFFASYLVGYKRRFINPPLVHAAGNNEFERVRTLLEEGHLVDEANNFGDTALHYASFASDTPTAVKMIHLLLSHHADVRKENNDGIEPLIFLQQLDDIEERMGLIGDFIKHGAEINEIVGARESLLSRSVRARQQYAVKGMIEWWGELLSDDTIEYAKNLAYARKRDEDVSVSGDPGYTEIDEDVEEDPLASPMEKAYTHESSKAGLGYSDIAEVMESTDPRPGIGGLDPLMIAVIRGDRTRVTELLEDGARINSKSNDRYEYTPLHYAVIHRDPAMVNHLLRGLTGIAGANPTIASAYGNTPLHMTPLVHSRDPVGLPVAWQMFQSLMAHGANINTQNDAGDTVLHIAVRKRHDKLLEQIWQRYYRQINRTVRKSVLELARQMNMEKLRQRLKRMS